MNLNDKMAFIAVVPLPRQSPSYRRRASITSQAESEAPANNDEKDGGLKTCTGCGREGGPVSGCDENGRIIGGLGAVLGWWPIKAYRPCPDFLKTKKPYKRAGQSLDEIAFGRKGLTDNLTTKDRLKGK